MTFHDLPYEDVAPEERRARTWLASLLRAASRTLDTLAERLALVEVNPPAERVLEFHADCGAPEGALYVNGQLVGHVLGVTRL
jgi:hypothetical protein